MHPSPLLGLVYQTHVNSHASACQKSLFAKLVAGEFTIHNSQWSVRCARRARLRPSLAYWAYFALLRPQGARFVRPPPLPSSIRNGRSASCAKRTSGPPLLIGLTTACFRHRRRPSCAPLQFPLKSYGFSGAETARKRFLLWKMGFSSAKIAPSPPYTPPGTILMREGFGSTIRHGRSASLASSLAVLPASLGLLRAVSPTGRALRAPLSRSPLGFLTV